MSRRALVEHVTDLRRHLGSRREVVESVALDDMALSTSWVPPGEEIGLSLVLESIFDGITVSGHLTVPWAGECRRCLGDVTGTLTVDVHEVFEESPTEGETWPLVGDDVDLEPIVADAVLLSLPLAPLCSPDCAGPAPEEFPATPASDADEGADPDRPEEPAARDPRWAALDDLDLQPENGDPGG